MYSIWSNLTAYSLLFPFAKIISPLIATIYAPIIDPHKVEWSCFLAGILYEDICLALILKRSANFFRSKISIVYEGCCGKIISDCFLRSIDYCSLLLRCELNFLSLIASLGLFKSIFKSGLNFCPSLAWINISFGSWITFSTVLFQDVSFPLICISLHNRRFYHALVNHCENLHYFFSFCSLVIDIPNRLHHYQKILHFLMAMILYRFLSFPTLYHSLYTLSTLCSYHSIDTAFNWWHSCFLQQCYFFEWKFVWAALQDFGGKRIFQNLSRIRVIRSDSSQF